jgi:hypothetical protein
MPEGSKRKYDGQTSSNTEMQGEGEGLQRGDSHPHKIQKILLGQDSRNSLDQGSTSAAPNKGMVSSLIVGALSSIEKNIWGPGKKEEATKAYEAGNAFVLHAKRVLEGYQSRGDHTDAIKQLEKDINKASGPLQELQNIPKMNLIQLAWCDVKKPINDLEKTLTYPIQLLRLHGKKEQLTEAHNKARNFVSYAKSFLEKCVDSNDPKVLKIKEAIEKVSGLLEELRNYKDRSLVSLALCDEKKPINALKEALEPIMILVRDKQEQAAEAYKEAKGLVSHAKKILKKHPNLKIIIEECINKASGPLKELQEYKDMDLVWLALSDAEEPIDIDIPKKAFEEALEPIRNSEYKLPTGVRMTEDGKKYVIDPSKVKPTDLAKLCISGLREVTFEEPCNPENPECLENIPPEYLTTLRNHVIPRCEKILQEGYIFKKDHEYPEQDAKLYDQALTFYLTVKVFAMIGKMNREFKEYENWYRNEFKNVQLLKERTPGQETVRACPDETVMSRTDEIVMSRTDEIVMSRAEYETWIASGKGGRGS